MESFRAASLGILPARHAGDFSGSRKRNRAPDEFSTARRDSRNEINGLDAPDRTHSRFISSCRDTRRATACSSLKYERCTLLSQKNGKRSSRFNARDERQALLEFAKYALFWRPGRHSGRSAAGISHPRTSRVTSFTRRFILCTNGTCQSD